MVYSGMGPDYRVLVRRARKMAQEYKLEKDEDIPTAQLVSRLAMVMQEFTQSGGVRPFGVSLLIAGWDQSESKPFLFQCDPSGAYFAWKATAMGKNYVNAKTFLEKRYDDKLEVYKFLLYKKYDLLQNLIINLNLLYENRKIIMFAL